MMNAEEKIKDLGIVIPVAPKPMGAYVLALIANGLIFTSGQGPLLEGVIKYRGKVGRDITQEDGYQAAKLAALNCLSVIRVEIGDLNKICRIIKVTGYVNSAEGFTKQPFVLNGASELLQSVFGENGKHARSAIGVNELPNDISVEVEIIAQLK